MMMENRNVKVNDNHVIYPHDRFYMMIDNSHDSFYMTMIYGQLATWFIDLHKNSVHCLDSSVLLPVIPMAFMIINYILMYVVI